MHNPEDTAYDQAAVRFYAVHEQGLQLHDILIEIHDGDADRHYAGRVLH